MERRYVGEALLNAISSQSRRNDVRLLMESVGELSAGDGRNMVENQSVTHTNVSTALANRLAITFPQIILGLLKGGFRSDLEEVLPLVELKDGDSIQMSWETVDYQLQAIPQVETGGVGRTSTSKRTSHSARATPHRMAIEMDSLFYRTEKGKEEYQYLLKQVASSVNLTQDLRRLGAILQCNRDGHMAARSTAGYNPVYGRDSHMDFDARMKFKRDMCGIINKTVDSRGFATLIASLSSAMQRRGVTPNVIISSMGVMRAHFGGNDDMWNHSAAGAAVADNRDIAVGVHERPKPQYFQNLKVINSFVARNNNSESTVDDYLTTPYQVGEFYEMEAVAAYPDRASMATYQSRGRDIMIEDENNSRLAKVGFNRCIANSMRFDNTGAIRADLHAELDVDDMFRYDVNGNTETIPDWKSMGVQNLPIWAVQNVVTTYIARFGIQPIANALAIALPNAGGAGAAPTDGEILLETALQFFSNDPNANRAGYNLNNVGGNNLDEYDTVFTSTEQKIVALAFLYSPVNSIGMENMYQNDVFIPLDVTLTRCWQKYRGGTVVVARGGLETGRTAFGRQVFVAKESAETLMLHGTYAFYNAAVVQTPKNIIVAPNVFCAGYINGNGTKFISETTVRNEINRQSGVFASDESLFPILRPCSNVESEDAWKDIRGYNAGTNHVHHPCGGFISALFDIQESDIEPADRCVVDHETGSYRANTVMWRGFYRYGSGFKQKNLCVGPLGRHTYSGSCASRQRGVYEPIRPQMAEA